MTLIDNNGRARLNKASPLGRCDRGDGGVETLRVSGVALYKAARAEKGESKIRIISFWTLRW